MTLPAELRAEADRRVPGVNAYYHDEPTRALLQRAADALEWRDIASAPKDGSMILLSLPGAAVWQGSWVGRSGRYVINGWTRFNCVDLDWNPSHWLPLPATPEG